MTGTFARTLGALLVALGLAPTAVPVSADAASEAVDAIFSGFDRSDGPGCAVGVARGGALVLARGYGLANLDHRIPISADTVFDIGSVSKQFTAAAVLMLADQGRLTLDDPVRLHVPELPDYGAPLTLRHLVHHTSGIRDYLVLQELAGMPLQDVYTLDDLVELIARQRALNFRPGEEFLYSNSGYILLAMVVERVARQPFGHFLQGQIFAPLGMDHSLVYDDFTRVIPGRATGYDQRPGGGYAVDHFYNFAVAGDGQIYTTLGDLARWEHALASDAVGQPGFAQRLLDTGRLAGGAPLDYAFGLRRGSHRGLATVRHGGSWGGFRAHFLRYPEAGLAVFCLCNDGQARPERLADAVGEVYLEDAMQPRPQPAAQLPGFRPSSVALEGLAGAFRNPRSGDVWQLRLRRGQLHARSLGGGPERELEPLAPGRFRIERDGAPIELRFEAGRDGRRQLRIGLGSDEAELYEEVELDEPGPEQLEAYAGAYRSDELDVVWRLTPSSGGLVVEMSRRGVQFPLWPALSDVFLSGERVLEFERDPSGRIAGFRVRAGRVQNLRFDRLPS